MVDTIKKRIHQEILTLYHSIQQEEEANSPANESNVPVEQNIEIMCYFSCCWRTISKSYVTVIKNLSING